ncbi:hypothetical protein BD289DRAFT_4637 [Coniella lustricola]|uniref:Uncharacterized protein n=1 Tax=Coniella lustricola TaxID=2025994 RepID=A0A2T3ANR4_9PEZI|nr:hypothetical protein BD289DRAFT_4637 [Coniella lustricola]
MTRTAATRTIRKFPWNLNLGTDICHVVRIQKILQSARLGPRFIRRILTPQERLHPKVRPLLFADFQTLSNSAQRDDLGKTPSSVSVFPPGEEVRRQENDKTKRQEVIQEPIGKSEGKQVKAPEREVEREGEQKAGVKADQEEIDRVADGHGDSSQMQSTAGCAAHENVASTRGLQVAATFMAGRFAAKEAVIKAHPHRALTWQDITIRSQASASSGIDPGRRGAPVAIIHGEGDEDYEALLSISHDGEYATAVCLGVAVGARAEVGVGAEEEEEVGNERKG